MRLTINLTGLAEEPETRSHEMYVEEPTLIVGPEDGDGNLIVGVDFDPEEGRVTVGGWEPGTGEWVGWKVRTLKPAHWESRDA